MGMIANDQTPALDAVPQMWNDTWRKDPERARSAAAKAALRVIETFAGEQRESLQTLLRSVWGNTWLLDSVKVYYAAERSGVSTDAANAVALVTCKPTAAAVRAVLYFGSRSIGEALEERQRQRRDLTGQDDPPVLGSEPADEQPITDEPHTPPDTEGEE